MRLMSGPQSPQVVKPSKAQLQSLGRRVSEAIVEGLNQQFPPKVPPPAKQK